MESFETVAVVGSVVGEKESSFGIQNHQLGGGGTGIDPEIHLVAFELVPLHAVNEEVLLFLFPFFKLLVISK